MARQKPLSRTFHAFNPSRVACDDDDYRPDSVQKDPEQSLALIFAKLGRDYGFLPLARRFCTARCAHTGSMKFTRHLDVRACVGADALTWVELTAASVT